MHRILQKLVYSQVQITCHLVRKVHLHVNITRWFFCMIMQHFDTNICFNLPGSQNYLASRSLFVSTCSEECWCLAVLHVSFPKRMELPRPCGTATGDIVQVDQQGGVALIVALAQSTFEKKQLPIAKCISWLVNLPLPNAPLPRK